MEPPTRRRYTSPLRRENAEATRLRIAEAARVVMLERGYAATTMAHVATQAGVAVQTIYAYCPGGKPALAKTLYDVTLAGDSQPIPQSQRPEVLAIIAEPNPAKKLTMFAAMAAAIGTRVGPVHRLLRAAAASPAADPGVLALLASTEQQRRAGSRGPVQDLASIGALRGGLTVERAADQVYILTMPEIFDRLTEGCGWTPAEYESWLARTLVAALLEP